MTLDLLLKLWLKVVDIFKSNNKCLLVVIALICSTAYITIKNENMIKDYITYSERRDYMTEQYSMETAPLINRCVKDIQERDGQCYDVMLIGYHNSKRSIQGYSYLYITTITEKLNGLETPPIADVWKDLDYVYFEDELNIIHNQNYLRIDRVDSIKSVFPKIAHRLEMCGAQSAAFYPIQGIESPIGFILILYKDTKIYSLGYYNDIIAPNIQKIASIMDFPQIEQYLYKVKK